MADDPRPKPRSTYHHGDLRRSLIEAATAMITAEGVAAVTLRAVGERVGVSRTALYRHFDGKEALLAAVAHDGFEQLRRDLEAAIPADQAGTGAGLVALGAAYVAFGTRHPAHYRTMFGPSLFDPTRFPDLCHAGESTFAILLNAITAGQASGQFRAGDPLQTAQGVWALVHGLVMLGNDGKFTRHGSGPSDSPALAAHACQTLVLGLINPPV